MFETTLTIGLFDKNTCLQEVSTNDAMTIISSILLDSGVYGATLLECHGIYRMESTGEIVQEPSIRAEFAEDKERDISGIIAEIKYELNQEAVMVKRCKADITFA